MDFTSTMAAAPSSWKEGRRVVELEELARQLRCRHCRTLLDLNHTVKESRVGLASVLYIPCHQCAMLNDVHTGCRHNGQDVYDVNLKISLAMYLHGLEGHTILSILQTILDTPLTPLTNNRPAAFTPYTTATATTTGDVESLTRITVPAYMPSFVTTSTTAAVESSPRIAMPTFTPTLIPTTSTVDSHAPVTMPTYTSIIIHPTSSVVESSTCIAVSTCVPTLIAAPSTIMAGINVQDLCNKAGGNCGFNLGKGEQSTNSNSAANSLQNSFSSSAVGNCTHNASSNSLGMCVQNVVNSAENVGSNSPQNCVQTVCKKTVQSSVQNMCNVRNYMQEVSSKTSGNCPQNICNLGKSVHNVCSKTSRNCIGTVCSKSVKDGEQIFNNIAGNSVNSAKCLNCQCCPCHSKSTTHNPASKLQKKSSEKIKLTKDERDDLKINTKCTVCKIIFRSREHFRMHKILHPQVRKKQRLKCPHCSSEFSDRGKLKEHSKIHSREICGKLFKCELCEKSFVKKSQRSKHIKRCHMKENSHICNICGKKTFTKSELREHMRIHTGERPFHCEVCDRTFRRKDYLTVHMRQHTGEKPYVCHHCGEAFVQRASLCKHIQIIHASGFSVETSHPMIKGGLKTT